MIAAFKASGAKLACLCSSDEVYAARGGRRREGADSGRRGAYLSGRPAERRRSALKAAGVGTFIYVGCDALATLERRA